MELFEKYSDEENVITLADIQDYLGAKGINAERKTVYDDIETLRSYGLDIIQAKKGYYLGSRKFELAELKLLIDSVQASKFITHRKSAALISKIESMASEGQAKQLQRQVYVVNRIKHMNESIYYNVDRLHKAIAEDKQISFLYFDYNIYKERVYRKGGEPYCVSPFALTWDNENYYLIAYDAQESRLKHYRVDKMSGLKVLKAGREGAELFKKVDMPAYSSKVFGMFTGSERTVTIEFAEHLAHAVIDRFGKEAILVPQREGYFTVSANVVISPLFFAWVCGFGEEARIIWPEDIAGQMKEYIKNILKLYE